MCLFVVLILASEITTDLETWKITWKNVVFNAKQVTTSKLYYRFVCEPDNLFHCSNGNFRAGNNIEWNRMHWIDRRLFEDQTMMDRAGKVEPGISASPTSTQGCCFSVWWSMRTWFKMLDHTKQLYSRNQAVDSQGILKVLPLLHDLVGLAKTCEINPGPLRQALLKVVMDKPDYVAFLTARPEVLRARKKPTSPESIALFAQRIAPLLLAVKKSKQIYWIWGCMFISNPTWKLRKFSSHWCKFTPGRMSLIPPFFCTQNHVTWFPNLSFLGRPLLHIVGS